MHIVPHLAVPCPKTRSPELQSQGLRFVFLSGNLLAQKGVTGITLENDIARLAMTPHPGQQASRQSLRSDPSDPSEFREPGMLKTREGFRARHSR